MQTGSNLIGRVSISTPLIASYQHPACGDPDDTGQADQLPYVAHPDSVPKLR